jgi:hypothetical protein
MNISRRKWLELMGCTSGAVVFGDSLLPKNLFSQALGDATCNPANGFPNKKFVFYIHCGSMDGMASGLTQPNLGAQLMDRYPSGLFKKTGKSISNNPLINDHLINGSQVFHNYSRILNRISNHACFAVGTPISLGHGEAQIIQQTGSRTPGGNPGWVAGLAQAISPSSELFTSVVSFGGGESLACSATGSVKKVASLSAGDVNSYLALAKDPNSIELGQLRNDFTEISKSLAAKKLGTASPSAAFTGAFNSSLDNLSKGMVNAEALRAKMEIAMSRENINAIIDSSGAQDRSRIKDVFGGLQNLQQAFVLAGMLIESGTASGMSFDLESNTGSQDFHAGGAYTTSTRSAAQLWAQVVAFWEWVKSTKRENDVMLVISHEFSRTAYNTSGNMMLNIPASELNSGVAINIADPGKDHNLVHGMVFINAKVPASSRMGALADGYVAVGSKNFKGEADNAAAAYSSVSLMGTMVQRLWCDHFKNERAVREIWPNYTDSQIIRWALA